MTRADGFSFDAEALARLLPAFHLTRDTAVAEAHDQLGASDRARLDALRTRLEAGDPLTPTEQRDLAELERRRRQGPLAALLAVLAEQFVALEENVAQLYDDQFIETCADWVVPYLGDLVGHRPLDPQLQRRLGSARAEVADTIAQRRRKGTAGVLAGLATGLTGWEAVVEELFSRLAATQHLNHLRLDHATTVEVRDGERQPWLDTPFDRSARTVDVRRVASGRGRFNIPDVAVHLWRVPSWPVVDSPAVGVDDRRYRFDVLGADQALYTAAAPAAPAPAAPEGVAAGPDPLEAPVPVTRRLLRSRLADLYGPGHSLVVAVGGDVVPLDEVEACDLADVDPDDEAPAAPWTHAGQARVAIDPERGRLVLPVGTAEPVTVSWYRGFPSTIGGGGYDRDAASDASGRPGEPADPLRLVPGDRPDLATALADLAVPPAPGEPAGAAGTVELTGNARHATAAALVAAGDERLVVRSSAHSQAVLDLGGDLEVGGGDSAELTLDGLLLVGGRVLVPAQLGGEPNRLQTLRLVHCTLVPGGTRTRHGGPGPQATSIEVEAPGVEVVLERCVTGAVRAVERSSVTVVDGIVDALSPTAVACAGLDGEATGGELTLRAATVVGKVHAARIDALDSILLAARATDGSDTWVAPVVARRRQSGALRYCWVPLDAVAPRRFACLPPPPERATGPGPPDGDAVVPRFTSLRYGHPAYGQLHDSCPGAIRAGASDGGELGAYHDRHATQSEAALRVRLAEHLRFGLEAGLFHAS